MSKQTGSELMNNTPDSGSLHKSLAVGRHMNCLMDAA
jgi:hypothetical protein